jgi:hypothetical protein
MPLVGVKQRTSGDQYGLNEVLIQGHFTGSHLFCNSRCVLD